MFIRVFMIVSLGEAHVRDSQKSSLSHVATCGATCTICPATEKARVSCGSSFAGAIVKACRARAFARDHQCPRVSSEENRCPFTLRSDQDRAEEVAGDRLPELGAEAENAVASLLE
jgi:hypothetical protein